MMTYKIDQLIEKKVLITDGGMGTVIQSYQLNQTHYQDYPGCYEYLNISAPLIIQEIHCSFIQAGADIIETNTFGANQLSLEEKKLADRTAEINFRAVQIAKQAVKLSNKDGIMISGSVGPGTKLPSLNQVSYKKLHQSYLPQFQGLLQGGVDLIQIETCQDPLQIKAAVLAAVDKMNELNTKVPLIVQVTVDKFGKLLVGTSLQAVVSILQSFDLWALGINCGFGPVQLEDSLEELVRINPFPTSFIPNAGIPKTVNGKLHYDLNSDDFADQVSELVKRHSVAITGGCCGTTPEYIQKLKRNMEHYVPSIRKKEKKPSVCSLYKSLPLSQHPKPFIISEKTNVTGSRKFKNALLEDDYTTLFNIAQEQQKHQIHALDLSLGYSGRDEMKDALTMISHLNQSLTVPLCFDSTDPEVIQAELERYSGKCIINSVNLQNPQKAEKIFFLASRFKAALICLLMDEQGMALSLNRKMAIAERLYNMATRDYRIKPYDLIFDPLTFTLGSGKRDYADSAHQSLKAIAEMNTKYPQVYTVLGISNVSYGLKPKLRKVLNSVFLFHAVKQGLDIAIVDHSKIIPVTKLPPKLITLAEDLLFNRSSSQYNPLMELIRWHGEADFFKVSENKLFESVADQLSSQLINGDLSISQTVEKALTDHKPNEILNNILLPSMDKVGQLFEQGLMQLPFVLKSAEAMHSAIAVLKPHLSASVELSSSKVLLATVRGDIHDIGKNLVNIILTNNGIEVEDIGVDQSPQDILKAVNKYKPDFIGLSGLLVESGLEMKQIIKFLNSHQVSLPIICGGAGLNKEFVLTHLKPLYPGPVFYGRDGFQALHIIRNYIQQF
ncbi:MAG: homocysteine S-methyltransferase family protein [bacterium]